LQALCDGLLGPTLCAKGETHSFSLPAWPFLLFRFPQLIPELSVFATDMPLFRGFNSLLAGCGSDQNVTVFAPTDEAFLEAVQMGQAKAKRKRKKERE
jgi:hypothetical protein